MVRAASLTLSASGIVAPWARPVAVDPLTSPATSQLALLACFARFFTGGFDNAAQAAADAAVGKAPREGGGHEHIRCGVQALRAGALGFEGAAFLADYRFPARGDASFRTRLYAVAPAEAPAAGLMMRIYRLEEADMTALLAADFDAAALTWTAAHFAPDRHIPDCDVAWRYVGAAAADRRRGTAAMAAHFDGELAGGDAMVFSPVLKQSIRVTDSLQLFERALWINDRGYDLSGNQIYGNWEGVPYKLARTH
jgi:hypothetical protein